MGMWIPARLSHRIPKPWSWAKPQKSFNSLRVKSLCLRQDSDVLELGLSIYSEMEWGLPVRPVAQAGRLFWIED